MRADRRLIQARLAPASSWYSIKNLSVDTTEIFVFDEISYWGVTADQFAKDIAAVTTPNLVVRINSPGGDVFDGIAIYNALRQHSAHVTTRVDSLAASIASVIAQAGDTRQIMSRGQLMIHEASGVMMGNAEEMLSFAELLDKQSELIASIYAEHSGGDQANFRSLMKAESWLSDQEVLDLGLADEIVQPVNKSANEETTTNTITTSNAVDWDSFLAAQEALSLEGI